MSSARRPMVLFTHSFPFGNNENFLETEICYLARHFFPLLIVPNSMSTHKREVPESVEIDTTYAELSPKASVQSCFSRLRRALSSQLLYQEIKKHPKVLLNPLHLKRLLGFLDKTENCYQWLLNFFLKRPDLNKTIFYSYWFLEEAVAIGLLKKRLNLKVSAVSRAHGCDIYSEEYRPYYIPLREQALNHIDRLYTISNHGRTYLGKYPEFVDRIQTSKLGVNDPQCLTQSSCPQKISIVSCSHLNSLKRIHLIIESLSHCAHQNPNVVIEWNHFGEGPLFKKLHAQATRDLKSVTWKFHGFIPNSTLIAFYKSNPVDLFISVSRSEGIPVSIMEAQSCGIPVLATNVGGVSEIVNEENGKLLGPHPNSEEIAQVITALSQDRALLAIKAAASKENWKKHYSAEINFECFSALLKTLGS